MMIETADGPSAEAHHGVGSVSPTLNPATTVSPEAPRKTYAESVEGRRSVDQQPNHDWLNAESDEADTDVDEDDDPLCPTIRLSKKEVEAIRAPGRKALIIKMMGRRVGYAYLRRRLSSMWRSKGSMDLIAIANDYFLVRFGSIDDLEFAMYKGPWMILDHYLIVKPWEPDFDPYNDTKEKVLVWLRVPDLPAEYFDNIFLRKLGNRIRRIVRVDQATSLVSRGMFARICVELDMREPLISKFTYKGKGRFAARQPARSHKNGRGQGEENGTRDGGLVQAYKFAPLVGDEPEADGDRVVETEQAARGVMDNSRRKDMPGMGEPGETSNAGAPSPRVRQQMSVNVAVVATGRPGRENGQAPRRAAEENENIVVRGRQGGLGVKTTRVLSGGLAKDLPSQVWYTTKEHHSDPPRRFDEEGDVVIELETGLGAGGRSFQRVLKNLIRTHRPNLLGQRVLKILIRTHRPNLLGLVKPKVSGTQADGICARLGFSDWIRVEAVGFSGGIWVFWNKPIEVQEIGEAPWGLAVVYGSPAHHLRKRLWNDLRARKRNIPCEWVAVGDFNAVTCKEEISNYTALANQRNEDFVNWIHDEGMVNLGFNGPRLTWMRGLDNLTAKGARLDRALCSVDWRHRFGDANVRHLPHVGSDHAPLLLQSCTPGRGQVSYNFKFQAAWLTNESFSAVIRQAWSLGHGLQENIKKVQEDLSVWNREIFDSIEVRKKIMLARIGGIQKRMTQSFHRGLWKLEKQLCGELEEVLYQEELMWYQRSREEWIVSGDRNTRFYHTATMVKKTRNRIMSLKDEEGGKENKKQNREFEG
ncbi:PREDICTED: uncharacterized protein LOC109172167 [Ipomoea nil]|uniref:uncharacterized protein LOC109172167 n=1 Tax=Ipomoea nil TaxID=35883 RepID=UPI000901ED07|nr:PREDICTED: uncharacterized protein LOC109172167 [Ipomoea nil]